jgi:hypothetical protein
MNKFQFEDETAFDLDSIDDEEDIKAKDGINTNNHHNEMRCDCCRRPLSELTPFGKAGDPLVGDFDGALLVRKFMEDAPHNAVVERIYDEFFYNCPTDKEFQKAKEKLAQKYGELQAKYIINWVHMSGSVGPSRQCRDCICLDWYEFEERHADSLDTPERCDCCGRHLGELKPFTERDPVMDYFNGKLLARRKRPSDPPADEVNKMMDEFFGNCITYEDRSEALEKLKEKYGEEKAIEIWTFAFFLDDLFRSSWECRDCILLDTNQYYEKKTAQESGSGQDSPG